MIKKPTTWLMMALFIAVFSTNVSASKHNANDMTCQELLEQDYYDIPVVVGYLWAYNTKTGTYQVIQVDEMDVVEVDDVIEYCQKNPKDKATTAVQKSSD